MQTTAQKVNEIIDRILYLVKRREEINQELTQTRAKLMQLVFPAQEPHTDVVDTSQFGVKFD